MTYCQGKPARTSHLNSGMYGSHRKGDSWNAIWGCARKRVQSLISDRSQAADVTEIAVAQVSRHRAGVVMFSRKVDGLLDVCLSLRNRNKLLLNRVDSNVECKIAR